jgi:hypothetical protein
MKIGISYLSPNPSQIKPDSKVIFQKEGTGLFTALTCHLTAGC